MSDVMPETSATATFVSQADDDLPAPADQLRAISDVTEVYPTEIDLTIGTEPPPLGRGWAFDPQLKGFKRAPNGKGVLSTYGVATLRTWIAKCIATERGVHPIYSDDFGMDGLSELFGQPISEVPMSRYEKMLTDALTYHPRITDVQNFVADLTPDGNGYIARWDVVLDDGSVLAFEETIGS